MRCARHPETVDAIIAFDSLQPANTSYRIRMNHTDLPSNFALINYFSPAPDEEYKQYWFFANLQVLLEAAILGRAAGGAGPTDVDITFKPFPWPAVKIDLGDATLPDSHDP